ncbi:inversin-A-like [Actinia tenebrosa]|uniref:Inversin-A-like n=1 Tax=Actinia tenebrosa TaxID=6105 RepID=A0A6P8HU56_ACTTE|nr:inversin-A-like [Actinia tenebrosa]
MPALNDAISQRRFKQVYFLMNYGVDLNTRNVAGKTALMQLCELRPEETAIVLSKALVKRGARIELCDRNGKNSLVYAILHQREKLSRYFLEEAIHYDLNAKDMDGNTALSHAAAIGSMEIIRLIVRLLKKFRLSVDVPNNKGETPLMRAAKQGHISCAKFILSEGKASKYMRDNNCWKTALEWEESLRSENQPKLECCTGPLLTKCTTEEETHDPRRSKSATNECKESVIGIRPDSSPSLFKPKTSQRQEIERLFDVYKDQLSSTYRKGYVNSKISETLETETEGFDCVPTKKFEDEFEDDILEKSTSSGNSTRRLFAKGAAVVKFRKGTASRGQLTRTNTLSVSFPPGQASKIENASLVEKSNSAKVAESPRTALNRPRRPARSKSEIPYDSISRLTKGIENKSYSPIQNNKLPRIQSLKKRRTDLSMSTVMEDEENDD